MFKLVLNDLLSKRITQEQLQLWILNSMKDPSLELETGLNISRGTFICEFLNFLRDEVSWLVQQQESPKHEEAGRSPLRSPAWRDAVESPSTKKREPRVVRSGRNYVTMQPINKCSKQGSQYKPASISFGDFLAGDQRQGKPHRGKHKQLFPTNVSGESPGKGEPGVNCAQRLASLSSPVSPASPRHAPLGVEHFAAQLDPGEVTHAEKILVLCDVYSFLLDHNLVTSIVTELAFCMTLLLVRTRKCVFESRGDESAQKKHTSEILETVENCVFFSAAMMDRQKAFLSALDRSTLVMLAENARVSAFAPDLGTYLLDREETSAVWISPRTSSHVMYQDDTDTRAHFQSERTFNAFRKHRDQFYEVLSLWKKSSSQPGWCFRTELGPSVATLLASCNNPLNLFHFARLFRSQLLLSCVNCRRDVSNEYGEMLVSQSTTAFSRLGHFSGPEEFFRDFILLASTANAAFIQHLTDNIIYELVSLNDTAFTATDVSGRGTVGEETKEHFKLSVAQMMLLAKFLGFMVYMPYYSTEEIAESILEPHIRLRQLSVPPIDILKFLMEALEAQKLVLTLPWVVAYLRMLDQASYCLPYYLSVFDKMFDVYYNWTRLAKPIFPPLSVALVTVVLGSLFEERGFPRSIYFTWRFGLPSHLKSIPQPMQVDGVVDSLHMVDKQTLFLCCPSLWQLHYLLASAHQDPAFLCSPRLPPAHACQLDQPSDPGSKAHEVNMKLRDSFFSRQPVSVLKTVELVAERVSSSCVKHMETVHASQVRTGAMKLLDDMLSAAELDGLFLAYNSSQLTKLRSVMKEASQTISKYMVSKFQQKCAEVSEPFCSSRTQVALEALLPDALNGAIVKACAAEVTKQSLKRVRRWIHAHLSPEMLEAELKAELERRIRHLSNRMVQGKESGVLPDEGRPVVHVDKVWPPHYVVKRMLRMIQSVIETPPSAELVAQVEDLLLMVSYSIQHRQDMIPAVEQLIYAPLSFDLFIHLVARCHAHVCTSTVHSFLGLWTLPELTLGGPLDEVKERLICPRNIQVLCWSSCPGQQEAAWLCLADVLVHLQSAGFLSAESISAQFLSILQATWTQEMYHMFNVCIQRVLTVTDKPEYYNLMNLIRSYFEEFEEDDYLGDDLLCES